MLRLLLIVAVLSVPARSFAGGPCSGVKGGCGRGSSYRSSPPSGVVHVSGYTRKDGTYVAPHNRSRPDGDASNNWSAPVNVSSALSGSKTKRRTSTYRTKARTEARTVAWGGTGSAHEDADRKVRLAPAPVEAKEHEMRTWHSGSHSVEARFVWLASGKVKLHTSDDRDITVDLDKLSDEDRRWIDGLR